MPRTNNQTTKKNNKKTNKKTNKHKTRDTRESSVSEDDLMNLVMSMEEGGEMAEIVAATLAKHPYLDHDDDNPVTIIGNQLLGFSNNEDGSWNAYMVPLVLK
jgi:predicted Mrr-cat superfamily restriction endonuclease